MGHLPAISTVFRGGSYFDGEETAVMASLEERREMRVVMELVSARSETRSRALS